MIRRSLLILIALSAAACSYPEPGTVVVDSYICQTNDPTPYKIIHNGRYYPGMSPCHEYHPLPIREQRAVWTQSADEGSPNDESITFAAADGQSLNVDVGVGYKLGESDDDIIKMVKEFGPDLVGVIDGRVRDSTRHYMNMCASENEWTVQDVYGDKKDELFACAEEGLQEEYNPTGLYITRLTMNSEIRLPQQIKDAMEKSQAATQEADRARREVEETRAEAEKTTVKAQAEADAMRIRAQGEADANDIIRKSITPELLEMKRIEVLQDQAQRWDGKLPETVFGTEGIPLISIQN